MEEKKLEIFSGREDNGELIHGEEYYGEEKYLGVFRDKNDFYVVTETPLGGLFAKECVVDPIVELTADGPKMKTNLYFWNSFSLNNDVAMKDAMEKEGIPNVADGYIDLSGSFEIKAFAVDENLFNVSKEVKMKNPERSVSDSILIRTLSHEKQNVGSRHRN